VLVDLAAGSATGQGNDSFGVTGDDGCSGIAIIIGSKFDDLLSGDDHNTKFYGLSGNDALFGLEGDDVLDGGPGTNSNDGGPGLDVCREPSPSEGAVSCENDA
jgi:Ca2+-binding RTX toxin-like protein